MNTINRNTKFCLDTPKSNTGTGTILGLLFSPLNTRILSFFKRKFHQRKHPVYCLCVCDSEKRCFVFFLVHRIMCIQLISRGHSAYVTTYLFVPVRICMHEDVVDSVSPCRTCAVGTIIIHINRKAGIKTLLSQHKKTKTKKPWGNFPR